MIPICFCGNRAYFQGLMMCVLSIIKNTDEDLSIYVMTMNLCEDNPKFLDITEEQIELLDKIVKTKNENNKAIRLDMTELYNKHMRHGKNHENGYTPYAMLRLLMDYVPDAPDKMIYLDIDTMCCSNIKQLWDVDVEGYDLAMAKDYMGRFWIRPTYCNSGVLVMNVKRMKENGCFDKLRNMVNNKKMLMPDQTAMNKHAKKKYLPFKFNEQRKIKKDTVIKHFCKGIVFFLPFGFHIYNICQWERDRVHKSLKIFDFDDIYEQFDEIKAQNPTCF